MGNLPDPLAQPATDFAIKHWTGDRPNFGDGGRA
jgi:hypothetical protein